MIKYILGLSLVCLVGDLSFCQKAIVLEAGGIVNTKKIFVGETLMYKLKEHHRYWLKETILDINIESQYILFENRTVHIDEIHSVRFTDGTKFIRTLSSIFTFFSYSIGFWSIIATLDGNPPGGNELKIMAGSFLLGKLLKFAFFKTHRIKGRKRLRLIDITFYQPDRS